MAATASIEADRQDLQKPTRLATEAARAIDRLSGLKQGRRAGAVVAVLPQEDPAALAARMGRWVEALRPGDDAERDLVGRAARISWVIDRDGRCETARLSRRVKNAQFRCG